MLRRTLLASLLSAAVLAPAALGQAPRPQPGTPEYVARDNQTIADAYGRETAPGGQLQNPAYGQAMAQEHGEVFWQQLGQQLATPGRIALTPGNVFPGWNG